jgi:hypothetical protein
MPSVAFRSMTMRVVSTYTTKPRLGGGAGAGKADGADALPGANTERFGS